MLPHKELSAVQRGQTQTAEHQAHRPAEVRRAVPIQSTSRKSPQYQCRKGYSDSLSMVSFSAQKQGRCFWNAGNCQSILLIFRPAGCSSWWRQCPPQRIAPHRSAVRSAPAALRLPAGKPCSFLLTPAMPEPWRQQQSNQAVRSNKTWIPAESRRTADSPSCCPAYS